MNSAKLKETIANIVKEESEYQVFFKKALEKAGKSITDMSDEEKKEFFNKIDAAWDGKGEKNEGNAFGAAVVAAKKAGEDEFEVGGKTYKVEESVNEVDTKKANLLRNTMPGYVGPKFAKKASDEDLIAMADLKDEHAKIYNRYLKDINDKISKLQKKYNIKESVNEASMDWETHFKGFNEKELKVIQKFISMNPKGIDGVIQMSKNKDFKPFIQKAAKSGLGESVNEQDVNWNAVQNAIINFLKANTKILDKRVQAKDTEGVKGGLKSIINGLTNAQRSLKLESVNEGVINELSADTYKNTVKAALQRGDSKGNSIAVKALQSFGKAIAKELAGKSFEVKGSKDNLAKGFYRGNSQRFINQFKMTFTGEGELINSRDVKVFGSDEVHFRMKVEFQVPDNIGGFSTDVKFRGYEKYKFPGSIQFSIKQGRVWAWFNSADTELEFTRVGAREMAKLADTIVAAMDFPTKAKHNTIKQFDPMKVNESVNEAASRTAMEIGGLTGLNKDAVQKFVDTHNMDIEKVYQYVKKAKLTDRLNFVTAIVGTPGNSVQKKMIKMFGESVNELKKLPSGNFSIKKGYNTFADYEKNAKVGDAILRYDKRGQMIKTFVNGSELDKNAEKYIDKVNNITGGVVYLSKKGMKGVAQVPDYEKKEVGVLVLESKSVNEAIAVGKMVKIVDNPHWEAAFGKKGPFKRKVKMIDGDNVFFTDGSNSSMKYVKESVNEDTKKRFEVDFYKIMGDRQTSHEEIIRGDKFSDVISQATKVAKSKGMNYVEFYYKDAFIGSIDKKSNYTFKKGRNSEKSPLSVNEGRAFINAARKAKAEGKTEFEFNGKKYPVTLKEGTLNEMNPQLNKGVKSLLDKELKDLRKGGSNHLFAVMNILMGALTDANFHSESKKVPTIFGSKAKYEGDPMAQKDMESLYQSIGERIATMAKWDGEDIAKAVGFYVSMTIGRPLGQKIENLV